VRRDTRLFRRPPPAIAQQSQIGAIAGRIETAVFDISWLQFLVLLVISVVLFAFALARFRSFLQ
jgi:hypothetical protein